MTKATARIALLCACSKAIATTVAATVAAAHASHAACTLWAVTSDVAEATTFIAFLTSGGLLRRAVFGQMAWLVAAVADAICFAARSSIARLRAVA